MSQKSECTVCRGSLSQPNACNYCEKTHCMEHRLPEKHDCTGARLKSQSDGWFKLYPTVNQEQSTDKPASDSMKATEEQIVGSTPNGTIQSSPDVAPDGSVVGAENENDEAHRNSWWQRLLPW